MFWNCLSTACFLHQKTIFQLLALFEQSTLGLLILEPNGPLILELIGEMLQEQAIDVLPSISESVMTYPSVEDLMARRGDIVELKSSLEFVYGSVAAVFS